MIKNPGLLCRKSSRTVIILSLAVLFYSLSNLPGNARTAAGETLRQTVETLSSLGDRRTGTPGCNDAADYIRERLSAANPEQLDSVHFAVPIIDHQGSKLVVGGREITLQPIIYNAITPESLPPEGLQAQLVYVGKGELADFNGKEIEGAIVLMEFDSGRNWLNAASLGASALIYINRGVTPKNRFAGKEELSPVQFPCFWIEEESLHILGDTSAAGLTVLNSTSVRLETSMRWVQAKAENIFAFFPGTDTDRRSELLIVEAFYDSSSFIPDRAPGADEALSIAGLLDLADHLSLNPPERPFLLIATSGHAQGLAGIREIIWATNARSKDLRSIEKQLKADAKQRKEFIELLEQYQQGTFDDAKGLVLQKAIDHALKLHVDSMSTELVRLRMHQEKDSYSTRIKDLAAQRFILRRLGWLTSFKELAEDEKQLLNPLVAQSITEHRAVLKEVKSQRALLRSVKRFRSLTAEYEPRAIVSLHLSSHGSGLGAFHQGPCLCINITTQPVAALGGSPARPACPGRRSEQPRRVARPDPGYHQ
jgi:hypothetical protein